MQKSLKLRVITGYNNEGFSIDATEAAKAYYLFLHPQERGIIGDFAVRGQDIMTIKPDYNTTLGWNSGYKPNEYDNEEIRTVEQPIANLLIQAKKASEEMILDQKAFGERLLTFGLLSDKQAENLGIILLTDGKV